MQHRKSFFLFGGMHFRLFRDEIISRCTCTFTIVSLSLSLSLFVSQVGIFIRRHSFLVSLILRVHPNPHVRLLNNAYNA